MPSPQAEGITVRNLGVSYGSKRVIEDLDVDFPAGKVTTIIGPNGCGKSTLLKAIARLLPHSGTVRVDGTETTDMSRKSLARNLSMLPQSPIAPEGLLVKDLVGRGRHPHQSWVNQWSSTDQDAVAEALAKTRSSDLADRSIDQLSGGQKQRVWISMVLAQETPFIFLDEPTTYLDLSASIDVLNLVRELNSELDRTVVMVLHDLNLATRYSDKLVVLKDGNLRATGTPKEVITRDLLSDVFDLDALIEEDPAVGGPLIIPARPENMAIDSAKS